MQCVSRGMLREQMGGRVPHACVKCTSPDFSMEGAWHLVLLEQLPGSLNLLAAGRVGLLDLRGLAVCWLQSGAGVRGSTSV